MNKKIIGIIAIALVVAAGWYTVFDNQSVLQEEVVDLVEKEVKDMESETEQGFLDSVPFMGEFPVVDIDTSDWETFEAPLAGISFKHPKGWENIDGDTGVILGQGQQDNWGLITVSNKNIVDVVVKEPQPHVKSDRIIFYGLYEIDGEEVFVIRKGKDGLEFDRFYTYILGLDDKTVTLYGEDEIGPNIVRGIELIE